MSFALTTDILDDAAEALELKLDEVEFLSVSCLMGELRRHDFVEDGRRYTRTSKCHGIVGCD